jgi:hypothetical protein
MTCSCCSGASASTGKVDFQYAVKVVCGIVKSGDNFLPPGEYFTKTNIHNPSRCDCVTFRWKVAVGLPQLKVGPISDFAEATLCPDEALEVACADILNRLGAAATGHVEGWLVIESPAELDVVAVYATAQSPGGPIVTFATERVQPRCLTPCDDLNLDISTGVALWEFKGPAAAAVFGPASLSLAVPPWAQPPAGSRWIIPGALKDEGDFTFRLTFKLCSGFTSPSLNLKLLADYSAKVFLNGHQIIPLLPGNPPMYATLNSASTTNYFKAGPNELTIVVHNSEAATPVGLALHGSIQAKRGRCAGDGPPSFECPQICYEVFTRNPHQFNLPGFWSNPACNGAETVRVGTHVVHAFRAHLTGVVVPGTAIEYRGWQLGWTSWTPEGQTCGSPYGPYMSAVEFRFVLAPVCCSIGYRIRRGGLSNWSYDGQTAGNWTEINPFIYTLSAQISCV